MERYKRAFDGIQVPEDMARRVREGRRAPQRSSLPRWSAAAACLAVAVALGGWGLTQGISSPAPAPTPTTGVSVGNPVQAAEDLDALQKAVSFQIQLPEELPEGWTPSAYTAIGGVLAEVRYTDGSGETVLVYRMGEGEDVSGDFQTWAWTDTVETGDGPVTLKGDGTAVFLAVWVRDGLAFSLQSQQGMTAEAILAAAQSVK